MFNLIHILAKSFDPVVWTSNEPCTKSDAFRVRSTGATTTAEIVCDKIVKVCDLGSYK